MSFDKENPEIINLLKSFQTHHVNYLIIGGFAVNRYGYKRTTGDVDFYLEDTKTNRLNLISAFEEMGYGRFDSLLDIPIIAGYCEIMMDDGMYADLMTDIPGLDQKYFYEYLKMATIDIIKDIKVHFLHLNHLIENKKATGRPKDLLDVIELEKIKNQ